MLVSQALDCLGTNRAIWIDDIFNESPADLARLLLNRRETALLCPVDEIKPLLENAEYGEETVLLQLEELLANLGAGRRTQIRQAFFAQESADDSFPSDELSPPSVLKVCELLGISPGDRWTFDRAFTNVQELCASDDSRVSYIVDLNEAVGSATRGLEFLKLLWQQNSKGTAFILTHEAEISSEASKEAELRALLLKENPDQLGIPVCVISKQRIFDEEDDDALQDALKISIKRAGLRRSLSDVVCRAANVVHDSFHAAASSLLCIPPEQLEAYVFERGYKEGVSELHVVERILSSHISQGLRMFFGTDQAALAGVKRLRALRGIDLKAANIGPNSSLSAFRQAEVWETPELINRSFAPIACGDVFEADPHELEVKAVKKRFVLLAQPCDIAIRPEGTERGLATAFFVPLVKANHSERVDAKKPKLPFQIDDQYWACDFRAATQVRLNVLDLASFRTDGRVRVDLGHLPSEDLFPAQRRVYDDRTVLCTKGLAESLSEGELAGLQLTFDSRGPFRHFYRPSIKGAARKNKGAEIPPLPKRITWGLQRCGRVRVPYSVAMLNQYVGVMSRQAFDLDFIAPGFGDGEA
ncbi:hypothetical protein [Bradyrhizobium sp. 174]|uniref:hypothetical protein n=1 Tax=Bradyrhizobium sp. 174 TaxID=2782645 RepID=UPI001FFB1393|nr:hypothetical protein [Bradyrhizobium sp. 174]MCK1574074.1 hypothetical protein [Bradyrhizobium sp. 174]